MPYQSKDGGSLSITKDESGMLLNGKRVGIDLSKNEAGLDWIIKADPKDVAALRVCALDGLDGERASTIREVLGVISRIKPDMGWMVKGKQVLRRVLERLDPHWLMISNPLHFDDLERISKEPNLKYLSFSAEKLDKASSLRFPKGLRTLIIHNWDPEKTGPLPEGADSLRSLTIRDASMKNLSAVASLKDLNELHLISCPDLMDISALSLFPRLKALTLTDCKKLSDLSVIKDLKKLEWLGLPPGAFQDQFDEIMCNHTGLRVLELIECKNIQDITRINSLQKLESLVLLNGRVDLAPLTGLKNLRLIALSKESYQEKSGVEAVQRAHAGVMIVHAEPFCLGSGWILMVWPALLAGWITARRRYKKMS
jgi:hypothetical protein